MEELFENSCLSICSLLTDIDKLKPVKEVQKTVCSIELELLLYQILEEIIYLKDADLFFVKEVKCEIIKKKSKWKCNVKFYGATFNRGVNTIGNDIKSITLHKFKITRNKEKWESYFIIDI